MISRCVTVVFLLLVYGAAEGVERSLPLGDPQWALQGDRTRVVREAGRDVLEAIPPKARAVAALARVHVTAARAATHVFELGFSDIATVFFNGRPVFRGDGSYSFDRPRREGLIGFDQARLYLPLIEGDNEIAIIVSDVFGGWGIMGRFVSTDGLQVVAR